MGRTFRIGIVLLLVLAGVAIGVGAYHAGVNHGLSEASNARVVHIVDGYGGGFPFGLVFFPLFFFGIFFLVRGAAWRRHGGPWGHHHGPGSPEGRERIEELHRRLHEEAT
jgi:hypothetical protein